MLHTEKAPQKTAIPKHAPAANAGLKYARIAENANGPMETMPAFMKVKYKIFKKPSGGMPSGFSEKK